MLGSEMLNNLHSLTELVIMCSSSPYILTTMPLCPIYTILPQSPSSLPLLLEVSQWKAALLLCHKVQKESKAKTVHSGQAGNGAWRQETGRM